MNSAKHNKRKDTPEPSNEKQTEKRAKSSNDTVEIHKKSLEKILSQNAQIDAKLGILMSGVKSLEQRMIGLEKNLNIGNNNNKINIDPDFVKNYVKPIAKILFEDSIYPSQTELKEATETFLKNEHPDFFKKFKNNQWTLYYERNVYQNLLSQLRSVRGTFTSKVKDAMNFIFGTELPPINTQATPTQLQEWKQKKEVENCYKKLFRKIHTDQPTTYMTKIIEKLWRDKRNAPKIQIAFAISICETYLNPANQVIQMKDHLMKPEIIKNMNKFVNRDKFSLSSDEEVVEVDGGETANEIDGVNDKKKEEEKNVEEEEEYIGSTDEDERETLQECKVKYKGKGKDNQFN